MISWDFSKVEAGKLDLEEIDFNLKRSITEFADAMSFKVKEKGLSLRLSLDALGDGWVRGDPGRIRQVLTNLVGNAIKFTNDGEVSIEASLAETVEGLRFACTVNDSGVGIPKEKLDGLFEPFKQVDSSTTRKYGGTGLGLAIVKQLCELMGGDVNANSVIGQGSSFSFSLLLNPATSRDESSDDQFEFTVGGEVIGELNTTHWPANTRVLVVEDNAVNQEVILGVLEEIGLSAEVADNGKDALDYLLSSNNEYPYTLVFMDCQMPVLDGYKATEAVRRGDAGDRYRNIPIIAMTANAMKGDREKCIAAGMSDYLAKPVDFEKLKERACHWLLEESKSDHSSDVAIQDHESPEKQSLWNHDETLKRMGGKEDRLIKLVTISVQSIADELTKLKRAIQERALDDMLITTHTLKGAAANLSIKKMFQLAEKMEQFAGDKDVEPLCSMMPELEETISSVLAEFQTYLRSKTQ